MTETRKWSLVTVLIVVASLALGWFLLVAPKHAAAAKLRSDKEVQETANQQLRTKIAQLRAQANDLVRQNARIEEIRQNIPATPSLPKLIRDLSEAARTSKVSLTSIAPALPVIVPAATTTAKTPVVGALGAGATGELLPQLAAIPVTVLTTGDYFQIEQFLSSIESFKRSFLVTTLQIASAASGAASPVSSGSVTVTLTGKVFMTVPGVAAVAPVKPVSAATTAK